MSTQLTERHSEFVASFEASVRSGSGNPRLDALRSSGWDAFLRLGIPTTKDEEFRYLPLRALTETGFSAPRSDSPAVDLAQLGVGFAQGPRLVFVNGQLSERLSDFSGSETVELGSLLRLGTAVVGSLADADANPFLALNNANIGDGAFIRFRENQETGMPIHIVHVSLPDGTPTYSHPRTVIIAEPGSIGRVVESFVGERVYFCNSACEIFVGPRATLEHTKFQNESESSFHFSWIEVKQEEESTFTSNNISFGARIGRTDINVFVNGERCETWMNGAYVGSNDQVIDNHTQLDHAVPNCNSYEVYKGVLTGEAIGVFNGKIFVHQDAQKTDAKQTNQALLLSKTATINTKPQLEIFADDVKCTHGATVGQLRDDALFYLRARGIPENDAKAMLVFAFVSELIEKVSVEPVRDALEELLFQKLHRPGVLPEVL